MNDKQKDIYIAWLNDAHAMELGLIVALEKQVAEEGEPSMRKRIEEHLEETRKHADLIKECIERNEGSTSKGKNAMSQMGAMMDGLGMSMAKDTMVKNVLASYAAEHLEISSYTALKTAAESLGDKETAKVCETILEDEEKMAEWLMKQLPAVIEKQLKELK